MNDMEKDKLQKIKKNSARLFKFNQLHKHIFFNIQKYHSHH